MFDCSTLPVSTGGRHTRHWVQARLTKNRFCSKGKKDQSCNRSLILPRSQIALNAQDWQFWLVRLYNLRRDKRGSHELNPPSLIGMLFLNRCGIRRYRLIFFARQISVCASKRPISLRTLRTVILVSRWILGKSFRFLQF
jgi:hypothetical protein